MIVEKIANGTVIDHIAAGVGRKVLALIGMDDSYQHRVALMINVPSKKMGKKDIVKIEGIFVDEGRANLIALVSPHATINVIKGGKVERKTEAELPELLSVGRCPNPDCITNTERGHEEFRKEGEFYRCAYCERLFRGPELV
jgi:aspartate carbamoyltransferase regulatory subunit